MDSLSQLLIDRKTDEKFNRLFRNAVRRHRFSVEKKGEGDYYIITNGKDSLGFDVSGYKMNFSETKSPEEAEKAADRITADFAVLERLVSFTNGQEFVRFVVKRHNEITDDMICDEFIGDLKKVIVYTSDNINARILDRKYLEKWDIPREVLFAVADRNMCRQLQKVRFTENIIEAADPVKVLDFSTDDNEFSISMMMCSEFRNFVSSRLGAKFLLAVPSKDTMMCFSEVTNNVLENLGAALVKQYRWSSEPLTTDIFLYTSKGIEVAGRFLEYGY